MSGKTIVLAVSLLAAAAAGTETFAQQKKYTVDKVVAVVGNSAILYSELNEAATEIDETRRRQGYTPDKDPRTEALEQLMLRKLLSNQARIDSLQINTDAIGQQVEYILAGMVAEAGGSIADLEAQTGKAYYDIRQDLKNRYEEVYYAQAMRDEIISKVHITPGEVERFYRHLDTDSLPPVPEQYVYAQIVKYPSSGTEARQRVREQLLDMRERIINGTRFDLLARMYSLDNSASQGGDLGWVQLNTLVPQFADALEKLQPGQVSEVVETEYGYHLIELLEKKNEVYHARHILMRPVYTPEELAADGRFLDSLATEIRAGRITFEEAARKYSDDKYSRNNGGIVTNHEILENFDGDISYSTTKFLREELYSDYPAISALREGEISTSFQSQDIRSNQLNKIIKLIQIIPAHTPNLQEDYIRVESLALQAKQQEEFDKWVSGKIHGLYVRIEPEFRNLNFDNSNWVK